MTFPLCTPQLRRASLFAIAALFAAGVASAQSTPSRTQSGGGGYSSSEAGLQDFGDFALLEAPRPAASSAAVGSGGQYGNSSGASATGKFYHNWTFEAGGGFNAPIGNDTDQYGVVETSTGKPEGLPVITWGGNFTFGGGFRMSKRVSLLAEYQFMDNKLPGALITAVNNAADAGADDITAGNTHINSITGSPVIDLFPKKSNGAYLVGGFGWYHKSTNFQSPEAVLSYYGEYEENVTVASFTSNQWGGNGGVGLYHRFGGLYGDSHTMLFGEARYLFIHTPPASQSNGLGTTELIPVTIGVRF